MTKGSFLVELKRRHVYRVAVAYAIIGWLLIQVATQVFPVFAMPNWTEQIVVLLILIGFPIALVLAWAFDATPHCVVRTDAAHALIGNVAAPRSRRTGIAVGAIGVLIAASAGSGYWWHRARPADTAPMAAVSVAARPAISPASALPAKSIAVLPFENLSDDKNNAYFADGIQDEILTGLAKIGDLKVISRTSTQQYASKPANLSDIARQLGVANILEGSVQKEANEVRINVQLIDARSDNHIWAQTYDRKLDDVFAVESEVAQKIAASLQAKITQDERTALTTKPTDSPAAYAAYLKARALLNRSTFDRGNMEQIIGAFREAVTLDPGFALAWAELVQQHVWMYWEGFDPTPARLATAKAALDRALVLAPAAPQVELAQAWYLYYGKHDYGAALTAFLKAQPGLPNDVQVWTGTGDVERRLGHFDDAVADFQHAHRLNPNSVDPLVSLAQTLTAQRRFSEAALIIDKGRALDDADPTLLHLALFALWSSDDLGGVDRLLATRPSDAGTALAERAQQALYRRDYTAASALFEKAAANTQTVAMPASFGGYIPAVIDWKLRWALSEQRSGSLATARDIYQKVKTQTRAALAATSDNVHVEVALRMAMAMACAGLDQREEAVAEGRRAADLMLPSTDAWEGSRWQEYLGRIYAMNGDAALAVPLIAHLLDTPGTLPMTPAMLKLDPVWDPIRKHPRFQAMLKKYSQAEPAAAASETARG